MSLHGGPSSEFDGDASSWSPEHLLLSSLGLCMLTTFEAFCARDEIQISSWNATINGSVERTPDGLMFTSIVLTIEMSISGNVEKVETTLEDAKQYCLVINSLRVPVVIETQIHTPDGDELPSIVITPELQGAELQIPELPAAELPATELPATELPAPEHQLAS